MEVPPSLSSSSSSSSGVLMAAQNSIYFIGPDSKDLLAYQLVVPTPEWAMGLAS